MSGSSRDTGSVFYTTQIDNGKAEDVENGTITINSLTKYRAKKENGTYDDNVDKTYKFDETKNESHTYTYYRYSIALGMVITRTFHVVCTRSSYEEEAFTKAAMQGCSTSFATTEVLTISAVFV